MSMPEKHTYIRDWIISTLRRWKAECKPVPLILDTIDIDFLEKQAGSLAELWDICNSTIEDN